MNFSYPQSFSPTEFYAAQSDTATGIKTRSRRPCDSCRRRKSRCEIIDGATPCVLCRFHRQECTFVEEPQPRKRKATSLSEDAVQPDKDRNAAIEGDQPPTHSPRNASSIYRERHVEDYDSLKGPSLLKRCATLGYKVPAGEAEVLPRWLSQRLANRLRSPLLYPSEEPSTDLVPSPLGL